MARIELRVPYAEKNRVKQLGARWDARAKVWFVPPEADPAPFKAWLPVDPQPNVRGSSFLVATSTRPCWRCRRISQVVGFMLPEGHETIYIGDDPGEETWELAEEPTLVSYVEWLNAPVADRMRREFPLYRLAFSQTTGSHYWMNHCEFCNVAFGDHETFSEPGQGFLAFSLEDARRIHLSAVPESFLACCGSYSIGVTLFDQMRRD